MEVKIGVIGAVDNAKTTTISCLKFNMLDDGRGIARQKIFRHQHEKDTGRTSSISKIYMNTTENNYVSFVDLAGHEKHLRTTFHGITGQGLDYAMIVVGANMGITKMTKEHLSVVISLKIPIFFVITKIDICPPNILEQTITDLKKLLEKTRRYPLGIELIQNVDKTNQILEIYRKKEFFNICPVFQTSNKTGENLELLKYFIHNLPVVQSQSTIIDPSINTKKIFRVHEKFNVKGVGIVVSGMMIEGTINKGDTLFIGHIQGQWTRVVIKNVHDNFRNDIPSLSQGQTGCLALNFTDKKLKIDNKYKFGKGVIIADQPYPLIKNFKAQVAVTMGHSTTIAVNYQPIIYCKTVIQAARVSDIDKGIIRCGDVAYITFSFMFRPEYVNIGDIFIFSEGNLRGIGKIVELLPDNIPMIQQKLKNSSRKARRLARLEALKERVENDLVSKTTDSNNSSTISNILPTTNVNPTSTVSTTVPISTTEN